MARRLSYCVFAAVAVQAVRIDEDDSTSFPHKRVHDSAEDVRKAVDAAAAKALAEAKQGELTPAKAALKAADAVDDAGGNHDDITQAADESADAAGDRTEKDGLVKAAEKALREVAKKNHTEVDEDVLEDFKHRFDPTPARASAAAERRAASEAKEEQRQKHVNEKLAKLKAEAEEEGKKIAAMGKTQEQALAVRSEKIEAEKQAIAEMKEAALASGKAAAYVARVEGKPKEDVGKAAYSAVIDGGGSRDDAAHLAIVETAWDTTTATETTTATTTATVPTTTQAATQPSAPPKPVTEKEAAEAAEAAAVKEEQAATEETKEETKEVVGKKPCKKKNGKKCKKKDPIAKILKSSLKHLKTMKVSEEAEAEEPKAEELTLREEAMKAAAKSDASTSKSDIAESSLVKAGLAKLAGVESAGVESAGEEEAQPADEDAAKAKSALLKLEESSKSGAEKAVTKELEADLQALDAQDKKKKKSLAACVDKVEQAKAAGILLEESSGNIEHGGKGKAALAKYLEITIQRLVDTNPSAGDLSTKLMPAIVGTIKKLSMGAPMAHLLGVEETLKKHKVLPSFNADKEQFLAALRAIYLTVAPTVTGPCECMKEWGYKNDTFYKGCAATPDSHGQKWCYVVGGERCASAMASKVPGEVRKVRECRPKYCKCPWNTAPVKPKVVVAEALPPAPKGKKAKDPQAAEEEVDEEEQDECSGEHIAAKSVAATEAAAHAAKPKLAEKKAEKKAAEEKKAEAKPEEKKEEKKAEAKPEEKKEEAGKAEEAKEEEKKEEGKAEEAKKEAALLELWEDTDPEDQCVCLPPSGPGGKTFYGRMVEPLPEEDGADEPQFEKKEVKEVLVKEAKKAAKKAEKPDELAPPDEEEAKAEEPGKKAAQKAAEPKKTGRLEGIESHIMDVTKQLHVMKTGPPPLKRNEPSEEDAEDQAAAEAAAESQAVSDSAMEG
eukprot:TRINITY_DN2723_c0_g1_i1.p1 TRINITY_DN2723_c0_g1~~TRINITY_DN2723_c0_g1_i1.p1  ORF type:complete len:979 (+),score=439.34 TRINITY_DN2723_c0_g1_i1:84-2939(+)